MFIAFHEDAFQSNEPENLFLETPASRSTRGSTTTQRPLLVMYRASGVTHTHTRTYAQTHTHTHNHARTHTHTHLF